MIRLTLPLALLLAACSPTLDWREVRPPGAGVQALFPCKPASHARRVALAGASVEMSMFACAAGDATYALAYADVQDPARVAPALDELAAAAATNLQAVGAAASSPLSVPGMTPNPRAAMWHLNGRLPNGKEMQERVALFAYGTRVYQATALGSVIDPAALETFVGALRVRE